MHYVMLAVIAFFVATFGSLIGAGGGFLLMPVLLLTYGGRELAGYRMGPTEVTFISLCAVLVNGWVAAISYGRMGRIDYRTGAVLAACTIPAAVGARLLLGGVGSEEFGWIFGLVLIAIAVFLAWRVRSRGDAGERRVAPKPKWTQRTLRDRWGTEHAYAFDMRIGVCAGATGGFIGAFFGIGGGILHVPVMTQLMHIPAHVASATSIMILAVSSTTGVITDVVRKGGDVPLAPGLVVGVGACLGALAGTRLSKRVSGRRILYLLSVALILAGGRLIAGRFFERGTHEAAAPPGVTAGHDEPAQSGGAGGRR